MRTCIFPVLLIALAGCSNQKKLPVTPVQGELFLKQKDGKLVPMSGARVVFNPVRAEEKYTGFPVAKVNEDGTFKLGTYAETDGAPEGEYVVTIEWRPAKKVKYDFFVKETHGNDALKSLYAQRASSPLQVSVKAGEPVKLVVPQP